MAVDEMEIDSTPPKTKEVERKRKQKNKDSSPSKKRKQIETSSQPTSKSKKDTTALESLADDLDSPFTLTTATLFVPLSPISISPTHALASLLTEHLSPLLLTYYPPLKGIVLAYSNASISSRPSSTPRQSSDPNPEPLTLATTADEYGVLYVYLTATFLVFRPKRGQTLEGWINVQSEGFVGGVVMNLFSVGIERKRLPTNWKWVPPGGAEKTGEDEEETSNDAPENKGTDATTTDDDSSSDREPAGFDPVKERFQPTVLADDDPIGEIENDEDTEAAIPGHFQSVSGHRVRGTVRFRVVDVDVIPGTERDRGFLSIEGTMLTVEEEEKMLQAERKGKSLPPSFVSSSLRTARTVPVMTEPPASAVEEVSVVEIDPEPSKEEKEKKKSRSKKKEKEKKGKTKEK